MTVRQGSLLHQSSHKPSVPAIPVLGRLRQAAPGRLLAQQSQFVSTEFSLLATLKKNCCDNIPCPRKLIKDFGAYGFRGLESMIAKQRHWDRNSQELIIS